MGDYRKYLASKDWKQMRAYRVALAGGRCEECGADRVLQAHHNTYSRVDHEWLDDLDVLCRPCHMHEHGTQPKERSMSATNGAVTETTVETTPTAVTIRTLSVRGSSMTLAVYRQLPERKLINFNNGEFYGTPWGTVNLCPSRDCPENERTHRHVVWESEGQLYRNVCLQPLKFEPYHAAADAFGTLLATHGPTRVQLACIRKQMPNDFTYGRRFLQRLANDLPPLECWVATNSDVLMANADAPPCNCRTPPIGGKHDYGCDLGQWNEAYDDLIAKANKACTEWAVSHPLELARIMETDLRDDMASHAARVARWEELKALPQLFLGV